MAGRGTWDVSSVHGGAVHAGCAGAGQRLFTWRDVAHGMWAGCWEALSLRDALGLEQRLFTWRDVALGMWAACWGTLSLRDTLGFEAGLSGRLGMNAKRRAAKELWHALLLIWFTAFYRRWSGRSSSHRS
ncbi:hypothetical protein EJP77_17425 [Paenibacillus zeisoli]|uniref:Uncharacterized protein n=1 Tax=Paenibacillus zeisoli TaxID=2496267 RepID=A0A3S1CWX4_9BACL|nr:hypothetical protein [Paenibacillus zeisoli]RUT28398.1 hypothetical protein EJP77_17425 [Paenibacillus zeisoli]